MLRSLRKIFLPIESRNLGRWQIKHEIEKCDLYMNHLHADPGYVNPNKKIIKEVNTSKNKDNLKNI